FPAMGNHDYTDARPSPETYLDYFDLPGDGFTNTSGNERYYDFGEGPVHFFVLNSNPQEPDGTDETSSQAEWLQQQLAASGSAWNIVVDHHPPYSSDADHGSTPGLQWPFAAWGADVVISGHAHTYERVMRDGITYFVNGLGGSPFDKFTTPVSGSVVRYNDTWGAQRVTVTPSTLTFDFLTTEGALVDSHTVTHR
ncbi:MAG: metallophosphoesterase, partial [Propionicimonas sp.]